jgi:F-type H+-transporting ATPase subunit epsilon
MEDKMKLNILTPDRKVFSGDIVDLNTENEDGRIELLPNHVAIISTLSPAVTTFTTVEGKKTKLFTSTGVLKMLDNEINMLCEAAEWPEEIDINRAEEAREKAEDLLKKKEKVDTNRAELKLKRAVSRIRAKS